MRRGLTAPERRRIQKTIQENVTQAKMVAGLLDLAEHRIIVDAAIGPTIKQLDTAIKSSSAIAASLRKLRTELKEIESGMVK